MPYVIEIEGITGAGKTTLAPHLQSFLKDKGLKVRLLQEPGSTLMGKALRRVVMDHREPVSFRSMLTEMFVFLANRSDIERVFEDDFRDPEAIILFDRYVASTIVYQVMSVPPGTKERAILNNLFSEAMRAILIKRPKMTDSTLLLDLPPELALKRVIKREEENKDKEYRGKYLEVLGKNFVPYNEKKRGQFLEYFYGYNYYPDNILVPASNSIEDVVIEATEKLGRLIKKWGLV